MCNVCHIRQWSESIFLMENTLQCRFYLEIQRDHIVLIQFNYLFGRGCICVALMNVKKKLLLTCIVDGMLAVVYPFCFSFRKRIDSSVLRSIESGKGLHSPQEYINEYKMNVKKNIFNIFFDVV